MNSLQGALGKTAGRSYKAAPRQLLQVDTPAEQSADADGAAKEAAKRGREALGMSSDVSYSYASFDVELNSSAFRQVE